MHNANRTRNPRVFPQNIQFADILGEKKESQEQNAAPKSPSGPKKKAYGGDEWARSPKASRQTGRNVGKHLEIVLFSMKQADRKKQCTKKEPHRWMRLLWVFAIDEEEATRSRERGSSSLHESTTRAACAA